MIECSTNKFIHAATFNYKEVIQLLELAGVAKLTYSSDNDNHGHIVF